MLARKPCSGTLQPRKRVLLQGGFLLDIWEERAGVMVNLCGQKIVRRIGLIGASEQILLIPSEVGEDLLYSAEFLYRDGVYRLFTQ